MSQSEMQSVLERQVKEKHPFNPRWSKFDKSRENPDFWRLVEIGGEQPFSGKARWKVNNGTLGNYTLHFDGHLTSRNGCPIRWAGQVWVDESSNEWWDFNPIWDHDSNRKNGNERENLAEANVRRMYIAGIGTPFIVSSRNLNLNIRFERNGSVSGESKENEGSFW